MESRLLLLGALALAIPHASAQTRVTGTIADMDGFVWANAQVVVNFYTTSARSGVLAGNTDAVQGAGDPVP